MNEKTSLLVLVPAAIGAVIEVSVHPMYHGIILQQFSILRVMSEKSINDSNVFVPV